MKKYTKISKWFRKIKSFFSQNLFGAGLVMAISLNPLFTLFYPPKTSQLNLVEINFNANSPLPVSGFSQRKIKFNLVKSRAREQAEFIALEQKALKTGKNASNIAQPSLKQKRAIVRQIASRYKIDWKILEAVWQVESGKSWHTKVRSYAGAIGPMQFIPSTFRRYAQDGDGDGRTDIYNAYDALATGANMLRERGLAEGKQTQALLAYNHAMWYVRKVQRVVKSIDG